MKIRTVPLVLLLTSLAACGGGGGGGSSSSDNGGGTATASYTFVPPTQGQSQTYTMVVTDVANDSATYSFTESVTQANADGSYTVFSEPAAGGITQYVLGSTTYYLDPANEEYDNKGQLIQSTDLTLSTGQPCTYTYPGGGIPSTVAQGQSWDASQSEYCQGNFEGTTPDTATFLGTESVTVPAGTFNAYKFQDITKFSDTTDAGVTTTTTTIWTNASPTDGRTLKSSALTTVTGRTPAGGEIQSRNWELTSYK